MRTPNRAARLATNGLTLAVLSGVCVGLGLGFGSGPLPSLGPLIEPAFAFDGTTAPSTASLSPNDGLRAPNHPPDGSDKAKALTALQYAADQGMPAAQWKLGQMYADGDGVPQDALRAFKYFSDIANSHHKDPAIVILCLAVRIARVVDEHRRPESISLWAGRNR